MKCFTFTIVCIALTNLVIENLCFPQHVKVSIHQVQVDEVKETQGFQTTEDEVLVLDSVLNGDCPLNNVRVGEICTAEQ